MQHLFQLGRASQRGVALTIAGMLVVGGVLPAQAGLIVDGASAEAERNILALSSVDDLACDAPRWLVQLRFDQLQANAERALQGLGFYQSELTSALEFADDCWQARLSVSAGPPLQTRTVDWQLTGSALDDSDFVADVAARALVSGTPFDHRAYRQFKQDVTALAAERGYFSAAFIKAEVNVQVADNMADVHLHFDSGDRYSFGSLLLSQALLDDELLQRYTRWQSGTPYSATTLAELRGRLQASGYFDSVRVQPEIPDAPGPVDVRATLSGDGRARYAVGAGFSSDIGPRMRGTYEDRRINRRGHQLGGELLLSPVLKEASVSYRRPLRDPVVEWLTYSAGIQEEDTVTSESSSARIAVSRVTQLGNDWLRTESLSFSVSDFDIGTLGDRARLLMPSVSFGRRRADAAINPENGHRLSFGLRGTAEALGSSTEFAQFTADAKWIRRIGNGRRVLVRGNIGWTVDKEFAELPPSVRFFAGGNESVRGFDFESLGTTDADGVIIGGSRLLAASIEIDQLVHRNFAMAVFVDAGNAFDGGNIDARMGAGIGIKWRSPVGPLRLYVARPLNFRERDVRLHISLGPDL